MKKKEIQRERLTGALKHESDGIATIIGLNGDDIVITGALEHLGHVSKVHPHGNVPIATIVLEPLSSEEQSNKSDMAGVHGLERETGGGAIEVGIGDQVLE